MRGIQNRILGLAWWGFALALFGCTANATQVIVTIDAEPGVKMDAPRLDLLVRGGAGRSEDPTASRLDRQLTPGGDHPAYPFDVALAPLDGDVGRSYSVTATAKSSTGTFVGQARLIGGYVEGQTLRVRLVLEDACRSVMCGDGQTCKAGACVDARLMPVADAAVRDGGRRDAGVDDAGRDGGSGNVTVDFGFDQGVIDVGRDMEVSSPLLGALVISEFAYHSERSDGNEFVEIHNRAALSLDIGGVVLSYRDATRSSYSSRAVVPIGTTLPPHSYFLLGSAGYAGTVSPDLPNAWSSGFSSDGGHIQLSHRGVVIDTVGYNLADAAEGGRPAAEGSSFNSNRSFERKALPSSTSATMTAGGTDALRGNSVDTDVNADDFIVRTARDPQNSANPPEFP